MDPPSHNASPHLVLVHVLALHSATPAPVHVQGHLWDSERGGSHHGQGMSPRGLFGLILSAVTPHQPHLIPPKLLQTQRFQPSRRTKSNPTAFPSDFSCLLSFWLSPAGTSPLHGRFCVFMAFFYVSMAFFMFSWQILYFHSIFFVFP